MEARFATATPLFAFDEQMRIVVWNEGAEELTGVAAEDAVGQPCWAVVAGHDDDGGQLCHQQCSRARLALEGRSLRAQEMHIRCADGRRRVAVETVSAIGDGGRLVLHLMHEAPAPAADDATPADLGPPPRLTPRQRDVLDLLGEGTSARSIATKLWLAEATVRNHIRAILLELGAHSQLEAVSRARCRGLLQ